jgi:capsular exopolysaccharide synthesis family protein
MKHVLLSGSTGKAIKTLMFFSSTEGDGVSTTLINFAITLASEGDKVLLVDANLRNPSLHDPLRVEKKIGLTELFFENKKLEEVVKETPVHNLSVVTGGIPHTNPSSIVESSLLDTLIEQMKTRFDWVLFDSPPINAYNDSRTLATKVDGVVMVVQAEKTRWEVADSARQRMEHDNINILGVVLNKRKMHIPEWAYKML